MCFDFWICIIQFNYMIQLNFITLMLVLVLSVHTYIRPKAPVRILTRRISTATLVDNFLKGFCTNCGYPSKSCNKNLNRINKIPESGYFKLQSIQNNTYGIRETNVTISSVNVSCSFTNRVLQNKPMHYVLYTPISQSKALEGVVIYFQPTLFGINQVPTSNTAQINSIASLFATSAYAILFINYLGYEQSDNFPHPYVQYPTCNVHSSIIALNHALINLKIRFPKVDKFKLFAAGYSEGAAYALWFEKCVTQPQLCGNVALSSSYQYRAAAAMDGPYDLLQVVKPFLIRPVAVMRFPQEDNQYEGVTQLMVNFGKPPLTAMALISFIYYSQGMEDYQRKMNIKFWEMQCTLKLQQSKCNLDKHHLNLFQALKCHKKSINIAKAIAHSAFGKKYNKRYQYLATNPYDLTVSWINSVYGLAQKQLLDGYLFDETINNASAIINIPIRNVFLFTLEQDSIVSPNNTINYVIVHNNTKKVSNYTFINRLYTVCTSNQRQSFRVDHNNAQILANIFALSFIKNNTK